MDIMDIKKIKGSDPIKRGLTPLFFLFFLFFFFTMQAFAVTEVKTSIGTRAAENVDISSVTGSDPSYSVVLASSVSSTVVGDVITDEAATPQTYLITAISGDGKTLTCRIHTFGASGSPSAAGTSQATTTRAYSTLQGWEDGEDGDLVTANEQRTGVAYADSTFTSEVAISGSTVDATRYLKLMAAESDRHNGVAGSGVIIDPSGSGTNVISISDEYTIFEGFEITDYGGSFAHGIKIEAHSVIVRGNLVRNTFSSGWPRGIVASVSNDSSTKVKIYNNIVYRIGAVGIGASASGTYTIIANNVISSVCLRESSRGILSTTTTDVYNNISVDNTSCPNGDYGGSPAAASNNISSDATAPGTNSQTSVTSTSLFINTTSSSEDFHLLPGAPAINAGTDLSGTFTDDVDGKTRSNTFDIGADEYMATGLTVTSTSDPIVVQYGDGDSALDFQLTFTAASFGIDIVKKGTPSTGTWGSDLVGSGTLFTIGGESSTAVHTVVQDDPAEVIIRKVRTGVTSYYHIYPTGRIVLDASGASSITVNQTATFTEYANGISHTTGYHGYVDLIETALSASTDYTSPDTVPTIVAGTKVANQQFDYNTDGFAEGIGAYTVQSAGNNAVVNFNGNTQTRYKPTLLLEEFYPSTKITVATSFYSKLDAATDVTSPTTGTGGTVTNGATDNVFGVSSSYTGVRAYAGLFNESGEYVEFARAAHIGGTGTMTFWYKRTASLNSWTGWGYLIGCDTSEVFGFGFTNTSNAMIFRYGALGNVVTFTNISNIVDGSWHHITITWDDTTEQIGLYVDGKQEGLTTVGAGFTMPTGYTNARIGYGSAATDPANGLIDDFRIYNDVVKPTRHVTFHSRLDSSTDVTSPQVGTAGTVAGTTSFTTGVRGSAATFDASGEYMTLPSSGNITAGQGTLEMWVKSNSASNPSAVEQIFFGDADFNVFFDTSGYLNFDLNSGVLLTDSTDTYDAQWHHVRVVWDYTADTYYLFVDGQNKASSLTAYTAPTMDTTMYLGAADASDTTRYNGLIDEFIIYDDVILPYGAYNVPTAWGDTTGKADASVLTYWDSDSTTINVGSGSATLGGSMAVGTGVNGSGLVNDNAGEYASFLSANNINADQGSLAFWVKSTGTGTPSASEYVFYGDADFNIFFNTSGYLNFEISNGVNLQYATDVYDGGWHFVQVTWDYTNDSYTLYVDGKSRATSTTAYTAPIMDTTMYFTATNASGTSRFVGSMDEIYITNSSSTPVIFTANGVPIRQPQLAKPKSYKLDIGEDLSGVSSTYLQEPLTDYTVSNANSASRYVLQYLDDITTTGAPVISSMTVAQTANTGNVVISYTGTDAENDTVTYTAADCEYSLDNSTWSDMTTSETTESFTSGGVSLSYTWTARTDISTQDVSIYDTSVYVRLKGNDGENDSVQVTSSAFTLDTAPPTGLGTFALGTELGSTASLSWDAVTDDSWANAAHYEIWYGTNQSDVQGRTGTATEWDDTQDAALTTRTTTSTTITGLATGTTYYYKIWAVDGFNNEATVADISGATASAIIANTGSGNWATVGTWDGGTVPTSSDAVTIPSGATITFDQNDGSASAAAVTIADGGTLQFDTSTAADRTMILAGDLTVSGTLTMRPANSGANISTIKLASTSSVEFGLIVTSTGLLDVQGTSKEDRDCIITALTQDGTKNTYIYLQDGSQTMIKNAEISYMGDNVSNKYGIYGSSVSGSVSGEGIVVEGSSIHNGYLGLYFTYSSNNLFQDNVIYSNSSNGIYMNNYSSSNFITNNTIYSNGGSGVYIRSYCKNNIVRNNVLYANATGVSLSVVSGTTNNYVLNNTIDSNTSRGIYMYAAIDNFIKNNIISNNATSIVYDHGATATVDYNLFYNNTTDNSTGTNAITAQNPNFVSTTTNNVDFMYLTADSPALGAGVNVKAGTSPGTINMGARLGYVNNTTDSTEYNWMQDAHDAAGLGAGDTVTTYAVDEVSDTIQSSVSAVGAYFVSLPVSEATIVTDDDYVGEYVYMTSGTNKGEYYIITDTDENTTDTIILYNTNQTTGFSSGDGFTIVDRVYARLGASAANLALTKDGSAGSEITWNTSGSVIVDAEDLRTYGIYGSGMTYNTINGFMLQNATSYGLYLAGASINNTFSSLEVYSNTIYGIYDGSGTNVYSSNTIYSNISNGVYLRGSNNLFKANIIYNNTRGIYASNSYTSNVFQFNHIFSNSDSGIELRDQTYSTIRGNYIYANGVSGTDDVGVYLYNSDNNMVLNNTIIGNTAIASGGHGIKLNDSSVGTIIRNNIITYNINYGIYDSDNASEPINSYNLLYSNTSGSSYQITEGSGTVTASSPSFHAFSSGTASAGSSTTLTDSGKSWTANQYADYVVWIYGGTGSGQFRRIESNTSTVLTLYSGTTFVITPSTDSTYKIIDWTLAKDSVALSAGANAAGTATTGVNIGAKLAYISNGTDSTEFNFLQDAEDDADYGVGDTLSVYAVDEVSSGTVGTTLTDNGPTVTIDVAEADITADHQYEGMYILMTSGTNNNKTYLIADSDENTTDTITLNTTATTGFSAGDTFKIVDRIYTRKSTNGNLDLETSGSTAGRITWKESGSVVLDAESSKSYNVYAGSSLARVKIPSTWTFNNASSSALGGEAATYTSGGYYIWGSNGTLTSASVSHASFLAGGTYNTTIAFTTVNAVPVNGDIQVTFGANFDISSASYVSGNTSASVSVSAQVLTINLGTAVTAGEAVLIVVSGIVNPATVGSGGTYAVETQDVEDVIIDSVTASAVTFYDFEFTAPTTGTIWGAGSTQTISWTATSNVSAPYTVEYWDGSSWYSVKDSSNVPAVNVSGTTQEWAIPVGMTISSTTKVRIYDNDDLANKVESNTFSISGGLTMSSPTTSSKWAIGTAHTIIWTESGTFSSGVKLEYLDDDGSTWRDITGGGTDDNGICMTGCSVVINGDGSKTKSFSWTPSTESSYITAGYATAQVRVSDANTSNPDSSVSSGAFTIAGIDVSYTPPDRINTAVQVGAITQNISWIHAGASYVKLQYYSPASSTYIDIATVAVGTSPYAWTAPNAVGSTANIKAIMVGADGAEGTSGIEGSVSDTLGSTFTIYGSLSLTTTYSATSYVVDSSSDRVPIAWSGSSSMSGITFEYTTSNSSPSYTTISSSQLYTTSTGGTTGYNWASGTGTTWWQPTVTGSTFWIRLKDSGDALTVSALGGAGDYFTVSGVSVTSLSASSPYTAGQSVTINGNGVGSASVKVYYATSLVNAQSAGTSTLIGAAAVAGDDTFSQAWTVSDSISSTIYLRVESGLDSSVNNTYGPYVVKGVLTVTDPGSAWTVGKTGNTVAGTVTGDIDTVDLQYTTDGGTTWTDFATGLSIGDNSGTSSAAFTISSGSFTVPDAVSSASFQIRVKDSTASRASALLATSSASTVFQVKGALSVTSPTSSDSWYVGNTGDITYTATGTALADVKIYYGYRKSASASNTYSDYTWSGTAILDTTSSAYMGSGTSAVSRSYTWSQVVDVVETLIGSGVDEQDASIYAASGNESWLMLRMTSANADTVYSQGYRVKYHTVTWQIKNLTGAYLSTLNVSESAVDLKPAWTVSDYSLATSAGDFTRYYPYYNSTISSTFTEQSGGVDYPETKSWTPNMDQTVAVTIDTSPSTTWEVKANSSYDYTNNTLNVTAWLEKQGLQLSASQQSNLGASTVIIYDSTGTQINVTSLSDSAADSNGNYAFSWDTDTDSVNLVRGQQYTMKTTVIYNSQTYTGMDTFALESTSIFNVQIDAIYDSTNDAIISKVSLLQNGTLVTDNTNMSLSYFRVLNASGTDLSGDLTGVSDTTTDTTNSIYQTTWDPAGGLTSNTLYTIVGKIIYKGNEYSGTKAFSMGELGSIETKVDTLQASLTAQTSTLQSSIASQTTTLQSDISSQTTTITNAITSQTTTLQTDITSQNTNIGAILEDTATTIPAAIVSELSKGVQAELLTRPGMVETGATTTIRYRTTTGLAPTLTVYDADNTKRVNAVTMTEIGSTGIYEYDVTLDSSWGTGEYTVIAQESTKSSVDSLILDVVEAGTTSSSSSMTTTTSTSTASTTSLDTVSSRVNRLGTKLNKILKYVEMTDHTVEDVDSGVDKLLMHMGKIDNVTGREILKSDPNQMQDYVGQIDSEMSGVGGILEKIEKTQEAVDALGPDGERAAKRVEEARERAGQAVSTVAEIKAAIQAGNIDIAMTQLMGLSSTLISIQESVNKMPKEVNTSTMTEFMQQALIKLSEQAQAGGFNGLVPSVDSIKDGSTASPEDILEIRNNITELKVLMEQVRTLMDKEVNKPVISGWLEGNLE